MLPISFVVCIFWNRICVSPWCPMLNLCCVENHCITWHNPSHRPQLAAAFDFRRANSGSCVLERSLPGDGGFCTLGRGIRPGLRCPQTRGWRSGRSRGRSRGVRRRDASAWPRRWCSTGSEEHQSPETGYRSENCSPCWRPDSSPA